MMANLMGYKPSVCAETLRGHRLIPPAKEAIYYRSMLIRLKVETSEIVSFPFSVTNLGIIFIPHNKKSVKSFIREKVSIKIRLSPTPLSSHNQAKQKVLIADNQLNITSHIPLTDNFSAERFLDRSNTKKHLKKFRIIESGYKSIKK